MSENRGGGVLGDRILWVSCVQCSKSFYCEYEMLHTKFKLICPFCHTEFHAREGAEKLDRDS